MLVGIFKLKYLVVAAWVSAVLGRGSESAPWAGKRNWEMLCSCFQGPPMDSVRLAERVVALICCEKLHKIGM